MRTRSTVFRGRLCRAGSAIVLAAALFQADQTFAQSSNAVAAPDSSQVSDQAPLPNSTAGADAQDVERDIVVTGSRIQRSGFDQPTPTTVIGAVELQQGDRPDIQQVLNDLPQFQPSVTTQVSPGNTTSGTTPVDLRGLGTARTLTLINGRRFVGQNNLNFVPSSLVSRVEVVTGGASAAWGSGAVAGVVNIILNDKLEGLSLGVDSGISSRGDAMRYGFQGSYGTSFAGGAGHFMIGAEYVKDQGIPDRNSRPNLGSTGIVPTADGTGVELNNDVNFSGVSLGGVISSGILSGQTFNPDGTLRAFRGPDARGVGGADGIGLFDRVYAATPFERLSVYARTSYDVGNATFWVDGTYSKAISNYPFVPDFLPGVALGPLTISATNPYLSTGIRNQLAAAGATSFAFGRFFADPYTTVFNGNRENIEGAVGVDGTFGKNWKYRAHFSHGVVNDDEQLQNEVKPSKFNNAISAVASGGNIVCGINADANPSNDDAACAPINPFGVGNISRAALAYTTGTERSFSKGTLDSFGADVQGDLFNLWAGPLTVDVGVEARWEKIRSSRPAETVAGDFEFGVYNSDLAGGFNVQEGFAEVALPLLKIKNKIAIDFNGGARYSHYSNSGGIWSWKIGGTARLFNDILLRVTRSRDIRSPGINELFSQRVINIVPVVDDPRLAPGNPGPGYNQNPAQVTTFTGGNPDLVPEIGSTLTFGGSVSPSFLPGFSLSVDHYSIAINGAIVALSGNAVILSCANGNQNACDQIVRDGNGTITTIFSGIQNIAKFETSGIDFEASYVRNLGAGKLRLHALATYVDKFIFDDGLSRVDTAGDVGTSTPNAIPKWRGNFSIGYDLAKVGGDVRVRYVDGGKFNSALTNLVNNDIGSRTYVDLGVKFTVNDRFTLRGNVNNLFDVDAPLSPEGSSLYDIYGTYYSVSANVRF